MRQLQTSPIRDSQEVARSHLVAEGPPRQGQVRSISTSSKPHGIGTDLEHVFSSETVPLSSASGHESPNDLTMGKLELERIESVYFSSAYMTHDRSAATPIWGIRFDTARKSTRGQSLFEFIIKYTPNSHFPARGIGATDELESKVVALQKAFETTLKS